MDARIARCHIIAGFLAADARMTHEERAFLEQIMVRYALTPEEREQVINFEGADDALATAAAMSEAEKQELLDDLTTAALADGVLTANELAMIKRVSAALAGA